MFGRKDRWFPPEDFYKEEICGRCGICCGSTDGHPCEQLRQGPGGEWHCAAYQERLGPRRTGSGQLFICAPIKTLIETNGGYGRCRYVIEIRRIREEMGQDASDLGRLEHP